MSIESREIFFLYIVKTCSYVTLFVHRRTVSLWLCNIHEIDQTEFRFCNISIFFSLLFFYYTSYSLFCLKKSEALLQLDSQHKPKVDDTGSLLLVSYQLVQIRGPGVSIDNDNKSTVSSATTVKSLWKECLLFWASFSMNLFNLNYILPLNACPCTR